MANKKIESFLWVESDTFPSLKDVLVRSLVAHLIEKFLDQHTFETTIHNEADEIVNSVIDEIYHDTIMTHNEKVMAAGVVSEAVRNYAKRKVKERQNRSPP